MVAGGDAFIQGKADTFFFALGGPKVREANASVGGIRAIGLDNTPETLRPGMQGVGKIDIGTRRLVWIWTHGLTDWFRLWSWSWMPWK